MDLPVACTLAGPEFQARKQAILEMFRKMRIEIAELAEGYCYTFRGSNSSDVLTQVASFVDTERQCCPFLTFNIVVQPAGAPIQLEVTGPEGAKKVIAEYFNLSWQPEAKHISALSSDCMQR